MKLLLQMPGKLGNVLTLTSDVLPLQHAKGCGDLSLRDAFLRDFTVATDKVRAKFREMA